MNDEAESKILLDNVANVDSKRGYLFVFTDFNIDKKYELSDEIRGMGWGLEVAPETNRKHLQGWIQVYKQSRFKKIIELLGGNVWVNVAKGTIDQVKDYCKKDGKYTGLGTSVRQGQKLEGIIENYEAGNSILDIAINDEQKYLKYHAGISKIYSMLDDQTKGSVNREMHNFIIWGDSGTGKTTAIENKHGIENCYLLGDPDGDNKCWNGYTGQSVLILDEFYSWIKISTMLRMLDGRPYQCRGLCVSRYAEFTHIYITLNEDPLKVLYAQEFETHPEKKKAFFRRFEKCLKVSRGNIEPLTFSETKIKVETQRISNYKKPKNFFTLH